MPSNLLDDLVNAGFDAYNNSPQGKLTTGYLGGPATSAGLPGMMFTDTRTGGGDIARSGFDPKFSGAGYWNPVLKTGANRPAIANPYNEAAANAARPGQQQALRALMASMGGQGVSGLQGNIAQSQGLQQAAAAMGNSRGGLAGAQIGGQAGGIAGGMAGDIGRARLQEYMQLASAAQQGAGGMRGQDLSSMQSQMNQGLEARGLGDKNSLFYAGQGANLAAMQRQAELERYKLLMRLEQAASAQNQRALGAATQAVGTAASTAAGMGK